MMLNSVVFPAPLPPNKQVMVPGYSAKPTASRICLPGKPKVRCSAVSMGGAWVVIRGGGRWSLGARGK